MVYLRLRRREKLQPKTRRKGHSPFPILRKKNVIYIGPIKKTQESEMYIVYISLLLHY